MNMSSIWALVPKRQYNTIQYNTNIFIILTRNIYMYTHDIALMLGKPPSHIGLICHFIHKVQDKIRGKYSTF